MKKLITVLFAIALCLSTSITAFATTNENENEQVQPYYSPCTPNAEGPHGPHIFIRAYTLNYPEYRVGVEEYKCQWCGGIVAISEIL